jgi:hypothetical protein
MQKPRFLLLTLAGLLTGILASCGNDDDDPAPYTNPLIYGRWEYEVGLDSLFNREHQLISADTIDTRGNDDIYIDFKENGTVQTTFDGVTSGTYRFTDPQTLEVKNQSGVSDQLPIHTLSADRLTFVITDTAYGNGNYSREYLYFRK